MSAILIDPVVTLLHNTTTNRLHPALFVGVPFRGGSEPLRHCGKSHHTNGFPTLAEATEGAQKLANRVHASRLVLNPPIPWDGSETPAIIYSFPARTSAE